MQKAAARHRMFWRPARRAAAFYAFFRHPHRRPAGHCSVLGISAVLPAGRPQYAAGTAAWRGHCSADFAVPVFLARQGAARRKQPVRRFPSFAGRADCGHPWPVQFLHLCSRHNAMFHVGTFFQALLFYYIIMDGIVWNKMKATAVKLDLAGVGSSRRSRGLGECLQRAGRRIRHHKIKAKGVLPGHLSVTELPFIARSLLCAGVGGHPLLQAQ